MFQEVKDLDYDYFIFMDEDVVIESGKSGVPLEVFEGMLDKHRPVVGVPSYRQWEQLAKHRSEVEVSTHHSFDACCTAIRRDVLKTLLPYNSCDDDKSWWSSQSYFIHLSRMCYPSQIAHFNDVSATNVESREYPKEDDQIAYFGWEPTVMSGNNRAFLKTIREGHEGRFMEWPTFESMGSLAEERNDEICLGDYFDMESDYWVAYQKLRASVLGGSTDLFNAESVEWERFHSANGSEATIDARGLEEKRGSDNYYHWMGDIYYHGRRHIEKNEKKAFELWLRGAENGNEQCMKNVAWAYSAGIGCEVDESKSLQWSKI